MAQRAKVIKRMLVKYVDFNEEDNGLIATAF